MIYRNVREDPFQVYGLYHYKEEPVFRRLPQSVAEQVSEGVRNLHTNTSGGRVKFKTNSQTIAIQCDMPSICDMPHMPRGIGTSALLCPMILITDTRPPTAFPASRSGISSSIFPYTATSIPFTSGWMTMPPCRPASPTAFRFRWYTTVPPSPRAAAPPDLETAIRQ